MKRLGDLIGNNIRLGRPALLALMVVAFLFCSYAHDIVKSAFVEKDLTDFAHYYFFSQRLSAGENIYDIDAGKLALMKKVSDIPVYIAGKPEYSPVFFLAMSVFTAVAFWKAAVLWLALNFAALAGCVLFIFLLMRGRAAPWEIAAASGIVFFASQPLVENSASGQVNILILLFLLAVFYFDQRGGKSRSVYSGLILGLILIMKPQFGLILVFFALERNWRLCLAAAASYAALRVLGVAVYGTAVETAYWHNIISNLSGLHSSIEVYNLSIKEVFNRLFFGTPYGLYSSFLYTASALGALIFTFYRLKAAGNRGRLAQYSLVICLILLISPLTEEHHLVLLGFPMIVAVLEREFTIGKAALLTAAFLFIAVRYSFASFSALSTGPLSLINSGKTMGILLLWVYFINTCRDESGTRQETVIQIKNS